MALTDDQRAQLRAIDELVRAGTLSAEDAHPMRQAVYGPVSPTTPAASPPPAYGAGDRRPSAVTITVVDATGGHVVDTDGPRDRAAAQRRVSQTPGRASAAAAAAAAAGTGATGGARAATRRRARPQRRALGASSFSLGRSMTFVATDAVLQDPSVRKQIAELREYRPLFTALICVVFCLYMIYPTILYNGFAPIASNLFWGPGRVAIIGAGAKFMPCMRAMNAAELAYFGVAYATLRAHRLCLGFAGIR
jgi:hypothetical protein